MNNQIKSIYIYIRPFLNKVLLMVYKLTLPRKIRKLRENKKINILFLLNDLSKWKTETLYLLMLKHERFNPFIEVTVRNCDNPLDIANNRKKLLDYLNKRGYHYSENIGKFHKKYDIIMYQEPYPETVPKIQNLFHNLDKLFISVCYSSHTTNLPFEFFYPLHFFAWFDCYESESVIESAKIVVGHKRNNMVATGLPMCEMFKKRYDFDPWKIQEKNKKKIIWAPHHSLGNVKEAIYYSTFLQLSDYILSLAQKYKNETQWAFKPHPLLRKKLELLWGKDVTDNYFHKWEQMSNTQVEYGDYVSLFQNSDAMIHDSSSFIIEYLYVDKPVMFLNQNQSVTIDLNDFGKEAMSVAEKPSTTDDIEQFIKRIINGQDINSDIRKKFISEKLSTNNNDASQNIIDYILTGNIENYENTMDN